MRTLVPEGRTLVACAMLAAACATWAGDADTPARALERPPPIYPRTAREQNIEGEVVVRVEIDAEGRVVGVSTRRSPHELLTEAVESAAKRWKYAPAMKDGKPVASVAEVTIAFHMTDSDADLRHDLPAAPDLDTVARYVASMKGSEDFRTTYWRESGHKAFASADDGAYGWAAELSSAEQAAAAAREECDRHRLPTSRPCKVVDIDGEWQKSAERTATPLRLLSPSEIASHPRERVETWSEERRGRPIPILDQCRAEADRYVQLWRKQDFDAMYATAAQEMRDHSPRADFDRSIALMDQLFGAPRQAVFLSQNLVTRVGDDELRLDLHSLVTYTATTAKSPQARLLMITLSPEAGSCRVSGFHFWGQLGQPPWVPGGSGQGGQRGT